MKKKGNIKLVHKVSVKSKFLMMILGIAVVCIATIGFQGLNYGKSSLTKSMNDHLTSLQSARKQQIETYFKDKKDLMKTFASQTTIIDAMNEFSSGFSLLDTYKVDIDEEASKKLNLFYKDQFVKKLNKNSLEAYSYTTLIPKKEVVKYLQYHYIVNNSLPLNQKELIESADDKSYYSEVHQKFHVTLREIVRNQGFHDLFLIDAKNQHIIYAVDKGLDFATDLTNGSYAQSSLAKVVKEIILNPNKGEVKISDFKNYKPAYNTPQAFLAVPIYNKNDFIGILATQISVKEINNITTGHQNWENDGLCKSGEVYIVGRDYKMRSDARVIIQNPELYIKEINQTDLDEDRKKLIGIIHSTVLNQEVKSESVKRATKGESGVIITKNYLNKKVLSAYAPLKIEGLDWSIIAEKEVKEAEQPIREFQNALLVSATTLATLITFYAIWLAYSFLAPITRMANGVKSIIDKSSKEKINLNRNDEFGELSNNIDCMIDTINEQEKTIHQKSKENDDLLLNMLPQSIATRVKNGEKNIAETIPNVAVLFSHLQGFDLLSQNMKAKESIELLNELIEEFDEKAQILNVEKITTIGDSYMAASGLITPRLDYARRLVEFALEMFKIVDNFNQKHQTQLTLSVGIDSGEVMAGIVGKYKFVYDIWGEIVNDANRISHEAHIETLRISQAVFTQLTNQNEYKLCQDGSEKSYSIRPQSNKE